MHDIGFTRHENSARKRNVWSVDLDEVRPYLVSFAEAIQRNEKTCDTIEVGTDWGAHRLCNTVPRDCNFYSFGISRDYSFDVALADDFSCRGFAADPTVTHPSKLHERVTFHQVGAKMLSDSNPGNWFTTSIPSLMRWRRDDRVDVLKMDCEGCEYSLAKDVVLEDPDFFHKVGQFAVEIHVSKVWLDSTEHLYSLGKLLKVMEEAGLRLSHASVEGCAPADEEPGCMQELLDTGIPCGMGKSCHNYLFARA